MRWLCRLLVKRCQGLRSLQDIESFCRSRRDTTSGNMRLAYRDALYLARQHVSIMMGKRPQAPSIPVPPPPPAASPQPIPHGTGAEIAPLVCADIQARAEVGLRKYGEPLLAHNGRDALMDAYQEALDLCMYLRQVIEERGKR